jgi:xylulokinase
MTTILSIDVGTTALKGVLFDILGNAIAVESQEYELHTPTPDIVECDPRVYWRAAQSVIRNLSAKSGVARRDIRSVGVTSQGETLIAVDSSGQPLRPAIVWLDNRSHEEAAEIAAHFDIDEVFRITGQQGIVPTWTATKVLWMRKHEPDLFRQVHKFLLVEDYLLFCLTGRYFTDGALNPSTLYFDITKDGWWPDMLKLLAISEEQLPEIKRSGRFCCPISVEAARATGLSPETSVTTAPIDQIAGMIGAGNVVPGIVSETTGAALAICATCDRPTYDPGRSIPCHTHGVEGAYALLAWTPTGGMALRWFRDGLGGASDYADLCNAAAKIPPGADGLFFLPYLSGAFCPEMLPQAKGVFWGLSLSHHKAHFTRAILESIAFVLRRNVEHFEALGIQIAEVRSLGGGAQSDLWLQIKADMLGKPCVVMECEESASLGVAMLSCVANGIYWDIGQAAENMVRIRKTVVPSVDHLGVMDRVYHRYLRLHHAAKHFPQEPD